MLCAPIGQKAGRCHRGTAFSESSNHFRHHFFFKPTGVMPSAFGSWCRFSLALEPALMSAAYSEQPSIIRL